MRFNFITYQQIILIFIIIVSSFNSTCQVKDTVKVMHYNLLYYGEVTSNCTANNNSVNTKDNYLKTIVNHIQPDIFTVNEMGCNAVYARRIRDLVLNTGDKKYELTTLQRSGTQNICSMLFYNTEKIVVVSQEKIDAASNGTSIVRTIDLYQLQFLATNLSDNSLQIDTPTVNLLTMHLKAGSGSSDKLQREYAAAGIMEFLEANKAPGNYLLTGDLNLYTNTEKAWENFTDWSAPSFNFYDPINRVGKWGSNSDYADIHTQSTRVTGGCHSGGGMDDRFDFILASQSVLNGRFSLTYIPETYNAVGQDGLRYNGQLNTPANNSAPAKVIDALYNMSDHLPVVMDIEILFGQGPNTISDKIDNNAIKVWVNSSRNLRINNLNSQAEYTIRIRSISGTKAQTYTSINGSKSTLSTQGLAKGVYFVQVSNLKTKQVSNHKIILP